MRRLLAISALVALAAGCGRVGGEPFQPTVTQALTLGEGRTIGQTFRPADDQVTGVDVLLATFGRDVPADAALHVALLDGPGGPPLWRDVIDGADIADNAWTGASGEAERPAGDVVELRLTWAGPGAIGVYANVPPADRDPATPLNDPYPGGELLLGGTPAPGDLAFRVTSPSGPGEAVGALAELARSAGARLLDRPLFAVVWVVLLAVSAALALRGLGRARAVVQLGQRRPHQQQHEHEEAGAQQADEPIRHP